MNKLKNEIGEELLNQLSKRGASKYDAVELIELTIDRLVKGNFNEEVFNSLNKLRRKYKNLYASSRPNKEATLMSQKFKGETLSTIKFLLDNDERIKYKALIDAISENYEIERKSLGLKKGIIKSMMEIVYRKLIMPPSNRKTGL